MPPKVLYEWVLKQDPEYSLLMANCINFKNDFVDFINEECESYKTDNFVITVEDLMLQI